MKVAVGYVEVDLNPTGSERICRHITNGNDFEPDSRILWSKIATGGTVLDIGAYSGLYAISAALLGALHVLAFEPHPAMVERLRHNVKRNKVMTVEVIPEAVSDRVGRSKLMFSPHVPLTSGASLSRALSANLTSLPVNTLMIDSLNLNNVRAVKIDVERHEPAVIRGMRETIARCRPLMLIELLEDNIKNEVRALLPEYTMSAPIDYRNYLFTPL